MADNVALITWQEPSKAYKALSDLRGGSWNLDIRQAAIVERSASGGLALKDGASNVIGLGTLSGSLIGAVVGVLAGPLGLLLGWSSGALFGALVDVGRTADTTTILSAMSSFIKPGRTALFLEVAEDGEDKLNAFVKESGGELLRRPAEAVRAEVAAAAEAADVAASEARKVLREKKWAEGREKLDDAWDNLKARFHSAFSSKG